MKRFAVVACVVALAACSRKKKDERPETHDNYARPGTTLGSAGSAGSAATAEPAPPTTPVTGIELANRVDECWGFRNAAQWDALKTCYVADAVVEPVGSKLPTYKSAEAIVSAAKTVKTTFPDEAGRVALALVDDHRVTAIVLHTGTNTGTDPTGMMQPNGKKFGSLVAQVIEFDDVGRIKRATEYFDLATMSGQLNPSKDHPVRATLDKPPMTKDAVLAKGDATEKVNVGAIAKLDEAFTKRDAKAIADVVADTATWSEQIQPKDWTKKELIANLPKLWKAAPELASTTEATWAVGDYVVARLATKLDKASDPIPMLALYKLAGGKITAAWSFFQSPPPPAKK